MSNAMHTHKKKNNNYNNNELTQLSSDFRQNLPSCLTDFSLQQRMTVLSIWNKTNLFKWIQRHHFHSFGRTFGKVRPLCPPRRPFPDLFPHRFRGAPPNPSKSLCPAPTFRPPSSRSPRFLFFFFFFFMHGFPRCCIYSHISSARRRRLSHAIGPGESTLCRPLLPFVLRLSLFGPPWIPLWHSIKTGNRLWQIFKKATEKKSNKNSHFHCCEPPPLPRQRAWQVNGSRRERFLNSVQISSDDWTSPGGAVHRNEWLKQH